VDEVCVVVFELFSCSVPNKLGDRIVRGGRVIDDFANYDDEFCPEAYGRETFGRQNQSPPEELTEPFPEVGHLVKLTEPDTPL
jgi:hypothetical protein